MAAESTRRTLWVLVAAATLTVMAGAVLGPVVPAIQDGLDVSESVAGLVITVHGAAIVVFSPVAGALIDRYGPRRPFIGGLGLYAVGGGAGLFIDSIVPMLLSRAVLGIGVACFYTGTTVLIYDLYEDQQMDRALGLRIGANSVGAAVWPLVGGALGLISWQFPFAVYLVAIPLGIVAFVTIPRTGRRMENRPPTQVGENEETLGIVATFRRRPALLGAYVLFFAANALLYSIVVFYPQLLRGVGVESSFGIGLYLSANGIAGGISSLFYDRLKKRFGAEVLVAGAFFLWLVGFVLATEITSPVGAFAPVVLFGVGLGTVFPSTFVWVEALAPEAQQGQFGSYVAMAGYVGQFLAPVIFGPLVTPFGIRGVFAATAGVAVIGTIVFTVIVARR